jgi:hypothetical protein
MAFVGRDAEQDRDRRDGGPDEYLAAWRRYLAVGRRRQGIRDGILWTLLTSGIGYLVYVLISGGDLTWGLAVLVVYALVALEMFD